MKSKFNYIVPIFNKEDILPDTLAGIEKVAGGNSELMLIVDGCTDRSEEIVDEFIKNSSHKVHKILMPNVHMLLSVNAGLKKVTSGFSIIMQDDIILEDVESEKKITELYQQKNNKLGVISFRYGSNIKFANWKTRLLNKTFSNLIEEHDFIKGPDDYANYESGDYGIFYPRMSAINGPNCIPYNLLEQSGLLDENLAPYGYDDPEYCLRSLQLGFTNGLFPVKYTSDEEWGGTRRSKAFLKEVGRIHRRNKIYIAKKHGHFLAQYLKKK